MEVGNENKRSARDHTPLITLQQLSEMDSTKQAFIDLCIHANILRFGEFELKSGRLSPYFFNAGLFNDGRLLTELANGYADVVHANLAEIGPEPMLYGPAYKGIPLAAATSIQLVQRHRTNLPYAFNRKEAKDHGEGGVVVGSELIGDVIIIDDVITAGTSVNESAAIIQAAGARVAAVIIALDRQEVAGGSDRSAVQQVENALGAPVYSIISLDDLIDHLEHSEAAGEAAKYASSVVAYRDRYGVG